MEAAGLAQRKGETVVDKGSAEARETTAAVEMGVGVEGVGRSVLAASVGTKEALAEVAAVRSAEVVKAEMQSASAEAVADMVAVTQAVEMEEGVTARRSVCHSLHNQCHTHKKLSQHRGHRRYSHSCLRTRMC